MGSCGTEEKRCLSGGNTADSMIKCHGQKTKPFGPFFGHKPQLLLGHVSMGFIIDRYNWFTIFQGTHVTEEIGNRTGVAHFGPEIECERPFDQGDVANVICHGLNLLV